MGENKHMVSARKCRGCIYADFNLYCVYILETGKPRPCPPGDECTVRKTKEGIRCEKKPPHVYDPQLLLIREMKAWWMEHGGTADELLARFPECKTRRKIIVADIRKWRMKKEKMSENTDKNN